VACIIRGTPTAIGTSFADHVKKRLEQTHGPEPVTVTE